LSVSSEPTIIVRRQGRIGRITLNRPRALNALDAEMITGIVAALEAWREEPGVQAVVVDAAGDRAFCAGGDVRELRRMAVAGDAAGVEAFFAAEYAMNLMIARYPKPYIAVIDGICMGGGVGLSIHGTVRVATEHAVFAMPETGIALFPDVGATYALPRLRGHWGMYLGLTGARLTGADAAWVGFATHVVPRAGVAALIADLAQDGVAVLAAVNTPPVETPAVALDLAAFGADSVAGILAALEASGTPWAQETLATLRHVSPSAVLWTFEMLRRGAGRTLEQALDAELAMTRQVTKHPDFAEGVRAMLVDKDRTPKWSPARIKEVDPAAIRAMVP